jgi:hypothetical protein
LGSADVTGDAFDLGIIKTIDDDLVVGTQQPESCADGAGGPALGTGDDPRADQNHDEDNGGPENKRKLSHEVLAISYVSPGGLSSSAMPRPRTHRAAPRSGR